MGCTWLQWRFGSPRLSEGCRVQTYDLPLQNPVPAARVPTVRDSTMQSTLACMLRHSDSHTDAMDGCLGEAQALRLNRRRVFAVSMIKVGLCPKLSRVANRCYPCAISPRQSHPSQGLVYCYTMATTEQATRNLAETGRTHSASSFASVPQVNM